MVVLLSSQIFWRKIRHFGFLFSMSRDISKWHYFWLNNCGFIEDYTSNFRPSENIFWRNLIRKIQLFEKINHEVSNIFICSAHLVLQFWLLQIYFWCNFIFHLNRQVFLVFSEIILKNKSFYLRSDDCHPKHVQVVWHN